MKEEMEDLKGKKDVYISQLLEELEELGNVNDVGAEVLSDDGITVPREELKRFNQEVRKVVDILVELNSRFQERLTCVICNEVVFRKDHWEHIVSKHFGALARLAPISGMAFYKERIGDDPEWEATLREVDAPYDVCEKEGHFWERNDLLGEKLSGDGKMRLRCRRCGETNY